MPLPPATASAEGRQLNGGPFPASATAEGAQFNVPPSSLRLVSGASVGHASQSAREPGVVRTGPDCQRHQQK